MDDSPAPRERTHASRLWRFGALEWFDYEPGAAQHSAADATHIRLVGFGLPVLLQLPVIVLYLKHPITRAIQRQLQEQIRLRLSH